MTELTLIVQTGDQGHGIWNYWFHYWNRFWDQKITTIFLTEIRKPEFTAQNLEWASTGMGDWATTLEKYLDSIEAKYIIYLHEDHFITEPVNYDVIMNILEVMKKHRLVSVKIHPEKTEYYKWLGPEIEYRIHEIDNKHKYLMAQQATIWEKDFFRSTLKKGEPLRKHEHKATKRIRNRGIKLHVYKGDAPIVYYDATKKGNHRKGYEWLFEI